MAGLSVQYVCHGHRVAWGNGLPAIQGSKHVSLQLGVGGGLALRTCPSQMGILYPCTGEGYLLPSLDRYLIAQSGQVSPT